MKQMQFQRCPNCRERNDVSVFVQGQLARCVRCSIRFTVERQASDQPAGDLLTPVERAPAVDSPTDVSALQVGVPPPVPADRTPVPPVADPAVRPPITSGQLFPTPAERPNAAARQAEPEPRTADGKPIIPGYEAVQLLGRGGMGEVWRARQLSLDRPVAVKILSPTLAVEPDFIRRFERESTALAALAHPHVVAVYDRGSANGHWYFVMEFVEGRSLRERAAEGNFPRTELLRLLGQVARAIEYAHRKGVIHRDLKPENVLIDHVGNAKVADFGLAGMSEHGRSSLTMTAVAMGTAHYMAPEQRRDAKNVDGRADLYSLGVMLYEMLCAEVPAGRFPSPREKVPDLDRRLDAMIMRLLDQDPERRPGHAGEVAELLETLVATDKTPDRPLPVPIPRTQSWSAVARDFKNFSFAQKGMLVGAAVLFVLILGIAIARGGDPPGKVVQHFSAKIDKTDKPGGTHSAQVTFGAPGVENAILALGPGWSLEKSELVREPEPPAAAERQPPALLQALLVDYDNAALEADVTLEGIRAGATGDKAPAAELLLYRDHDRNVGLRIAPTEDTAYTLLFAPTSKGRVTSAMADAKEKTTTSSRKYHVELWVMNGRATAFIDKRQVAAAQVGGLAGNLANVGFDCRNVRCRFSNVRLAGQVFDVSANAAQN